MRHHIWYTDILKALQLAAEGLITARNLAREGDGEGSDLFININVSLNTTSEEIDRLLEKFSEECCSCEGPNETYPQGYTCEADALMKTFRLSSEYEKGDRVIWTRPAAGGSGERTERLTGKISGIRVEGNGEFLFLVRLDKNSSVQAKTVELTWRDITLDIEHVKNDE